MTPTRVWFPGWQFGSSVFTPLQQALPNEHHINLSYANENGCWESWLERQHEALPERSHLVGWSLGGMLAVAAAMRRPDISSVTVLCANVQFAGGDAGLDETVAADFRERYRTNPEQARKRFLALVQGRRPAAGLAGHLLEGDQGTTLDWLYELAVNEAWLTCPVRVLLAESDALVPARPAATAWMRLGGEPRLMPGGHDLPWQSPQEVANWILTHE